MQYKELGVITPTEPHTNIAAAINAAQQSPGAAVWIPAWYTGTDTVPATPGVPVFDLRGTTGTFTAASTFSKNVIDAANPAYAGGVKANGHFSSIPTITSGSNIVTCADCNFTGTDALGRAIAKVGQIVFATNATTDVSQNTSNIIITRTTILSVDSATQIHTTANATGSTTASGFLIWGDLDSAPAGTTQTIANDPLFAAWTVAATNCLPLQLPAGVMLVEQGEFNTFPATGGCGNQNALTLSRRGFAVQGWGPNETIIVMTPSMDPTTCTGPAGAGPGCFLSAPNMVVQNLQIAGFGQSVPGAGFSGKSLVYISGVNPGTNFFINNVYLFGFAANQTGTIGLNIGNGISLSVSGGVISNSIVENFGATQCRVDAPSSPASLIYFNSVWLYGGNSTSLFVFNGAVSSVNGLYGGNSGTFNINPGVGPAVCVANGASMLSTNDQLTYATGSGGAPQFYVTGANSSLKVINGLISQPQAGGSGIYVHNGGKVAIGNSVIAAPFTIFTGNGGTCTTTCTIKSIGGNEWTATTTGFSTATGAVFLPDATDTFTGFANTVVSVSSGFGVSPSISVNSDPWGFTINVGTGGTATNGVIGLPPAPNGWVCNAVDLTTQSTTVFVTKQTASTTSTATIANFNTAGAQAAWVANDIIHVSCSPR